jgi:hypothetical protein
MRDVSVDVRQGQGGQERRVVVSQFSGGWDRPITIGSDPGCDVVLTGPGLAALHGKVY